MVGFEVTPTTCWLRRSASSPPLCSRPREMSSSQIETPAAESSANLSVMSCLLWPVNSGAGGGSGDLTDLGQRGPGGGDHVIGGEAELLEQHRVRRARPVVLQADALARVPDEIVPRLGDPGLHTDPGLHGRGQDLAAVGLILG